MHDVQGLRRLLAGGAAGLPSMLHWMCCLQQAWLLWHSRMVALTRTQQLGIKQRFALIPPQFLPPLLLDSALSIDYFLFKKVGTIVGDWLGWHRALCVQLRLSTVLPA